MPEAPAETDGNRDSLAAMLQHHKAISRTPPGRKPADQSSPIVAPPRHRIGILPIAVLAVVFAAVLIVHWPALASRAISFDDDQYLLRNPVVLNPSGASAWRFLSEVLEPSTVDGYYQPLAMISLMGDVALGGSPENLVPVHRTSLVLHGINTCLIIVLLTRLFGRWGPAALVGLLFGLHPMTVEPIAWIGERKTTLAACFALLCLLSYVEYARGRGARFYLAALLAAVLAMMSKPTTTPLPLLLLILDFWPIGRLNRRALLEKIPFFCLSGVFAVITFISQARTAAVTTPDRYDPSRIPLVLCHNIFYYPSKLVVPSNLTPHVAFPNPISLSNPRILWGVIGTVLLLAVVIGSLRWTRALAAGWLFFFIAILPTMQIVGFTDVIAADKYAYLPTLGLLMPLAWLLGRAWSAPGRSWMRPALCIATLLLAAGEARATQRQIGIWRDTETHYKYMLSLAPDESQLHNNLGVALKIQGRLPEALQEYRLARKLNPRNYQAMINLAAVLQETGAIREALDLYEEALRLDPANPKAHFNVGTALLLDGQVQPAIREFQAAIARRPHYSKAHAGLANAYSQAGRRREALYHYAKAVRFQTEPSQELMYNYSIALAKEGRLPEAKSYCLEALRVNPDYLYARLNLGTLLEREGRKAEAAAEYRRVLVAEPANRIAQARLAAIERK